MVPSSNVGVTYQVIDCVIRLFLTQVVFEKRIPGVISAPHNKTFNTIAPPRNWWRWATFKEWSISEGKKLPVLCAHPNQIAERALVVGDTKHAEICAALLVDADEVGTCHEYLTFTGTYHDTPIMVCSHGVGAVGQALYSTICVSAM